MKVMVYTKNYCPFCVHAKNLLEAKGLSYEEVNLEGQQDKLIELVNQTQMRTVPQIFINDKFIGGYSELKAFDDSGELDKLIQQTN